ncbi:MAG: molybdopterin oxidoreductase [Gallionellales bacterium RIFCSPLOWO2_12_FULL_59_22]|nr:MAG: molybdopterin oxidoreductase [Gallionellales bacterium RIFCSPLOWO2_02_FULL_59_110]OGT02899.1 MAG: molybdopterin oxidoreductase [Gallionellales bacterium RIFCSPLOWO2_02_58_13]OGT13100.1 MAG: molybdopterin oxidoreductase [Gallionellales bacterium RIFCSPLOWO2_12_FULL_59_22]
MNILNTLITRRRFLQAAGATSAGAVALGSGKIGGFATLSEAQAAAPEASGGATVTKSICGQCPARCGIDIYNTNGRVHAIYGNNDHPIANGKGCPKMHLGTYMLYDPDRFKGPMKRTNPNKGRNEDPKFVPISWDEAYKTVADRLNNLRDKGESHKFGLFFGRGWGATDVGLTIVPFGELYGSPNAPIGHSSICSDGSVLAKQCTDGNASYSSYDYRHSNYLLIFGANFLEAFRPYNNNLQVWGYIRGVKTPKTRVTYVDVHMNQTAAAADRALLVKPGTDGALALAIAHVILTEGLWEKSFVGDFKDGANLFKTGQTLDPASFNEKWVKGLIEWWNAELKDRTPKWAAGVTTIAEDLITQTAREFGSTRPAIALFERGAHVHSNGVLNGMAIHSLNALVGSLFAEGGLGYQMGPSYGPSPANAADYMDDYAKNGPHKKMPRIDLKGHEDGYLMAKNMIQEVGKNHLSGKAGYKLDTALFYMTNPVFSTPNAKNEWEEAVKTMFVIDTSPFPSEVAMMADIILPDNTYIERYQDAPTYPFQGFPLAQLRVPAIKPLYDTRTFGDSLIAIGSLIKGPTSEYFKKLESAENIVRHLAKGFEKDPGDNGVKDFETWKAKGCWFKKPYVYRQVRGEFLKWDGKGYNNPMSAEDVKKDLLMTDSGKFEFVSSYMEHKKDWVLAKTGRDPVKYNMPHWEEPKYTGGGDVHFISPKTAMHAEGRGGNIPHAITLLQPAAGGNKGALAEIHPSLASAKGIKDGGRIKIKSAVGEIIATARVTELTRPDTIVLPFEHGHWAWGRWAKALGGSHVDEIVPQQSDRISGMCNYYTGKVTVERA